MRATLVFLLMALSSPVLAASWSGVVVSGPQPLAGAKVAVFLVPLRPMDGCGKSASNTLFGTCLCPARREAFYQRARAGLASPPPVATTVSGADGAFSLELPGPGPFMATATSADGTLAATTVLEAGPGPQRVAVVPLVVTHVRVSGVSAGAVAYLVDVQTGDFARLLPGAGAGELVSPPLRAGLRTLLTLAPGALPRLDSMQDGRVQFTPPSDGPAPVTLSGPLSLQGHVTSEGRPVAGAEVVVDPGGCELKTRTNAKGEFTLPALVGPPSMSRVTARAPGQSATDYLLAGQPGTLALKRVAALEVTFVDPRGAPVPGLRLWGMSGVPSGLASPASDAKGRLVVKGLVEGQLELKVAPPWVLVSEPWVLVKGRTRAQVTVTRGVTLTGRVHDAQGTALAGVFVSATTSAADGGTHFTEGVRRNFVTDHQGTFSFDALLPGLYEVVATSPKHGPAKATVTAPGTLDLTLRTRTPGPVARSRRRRPFSRTPRRAAAAAEVGSWSPTQAGGEVAFLEGAGLLRAHAFLSTPRGPTATDGGASVNASVAPQRRVRPGSAAVTTPVTMKVLARGSPRRGRVSPT